MSMDSLDRFLGAQESMYSVALEEIKNGYKYSHWIWYIFPQLRGLGRSSQCQIFGIDGLEEAKAYLAHPVLSQRLTEITTALLAHKGKNIAHIMGSNIDAVKLRSSMTLFAVASGDGDSVFRQVLDCFYSGRMDDVTVKMLGQQQQGN